MRNIFKVLSLVWFVSAGVGMMVEGLLAEQAPFPKFVGQVVDSNFGIGYAVTVADINKDGKPDIVAINQTQAVWFENPDWKRHIMADGLTRLLAPILTFTADEIWKYLPGSRDVSVHVSVFPDEAELARWLDPDLIVRWEALSRIRERVLAQIEPLRKDKQIGSSLQAQVILTGPAGNMALLQEYVAQLPMLFIVSDVQLRVVAGGQAQSTEGSTAGGDDAVVIEIARAGGTKCERCWRYVPEVSTEPAWAGLCSRCQGALAEGSRG